MENNKKKDIAKRIALARERAGLSQNQLAKIMGYHRPTISEIEAGRRNVSAEEINKFSSILKVDVNWLLCSDTEKIDIDLDRIQLAARELGKLKDEDLKRVLDFLSALNVKKKHE